MRNALLASALLASCNPPIDTSPEPLDPPRLIVRPEHREAILDRLDQAPYDLLLDRLQDRAARDTREPEPGPWDHGAHGFNGETAQAAAFLAWLLEDEAAALRARELLQTLDTDFESSSTWDVNIRMPHTLMGYANAWDLLSATPWFPEDEAAEARRRITEVNDAFFERYVHDNVYRYLALGVSQNNHPIRTAAAIGYVGLAFPDHPRADEWLDWAISELDYLWGPDGRYVQADGGISEGPFYYGFALGPTLAFLIAYENALPHGRTTLRNCINRRPEPPWEVTDCQDGEPFVFDNPLLNGRLAQTVDWWVALRLPSGHCPPLADSYMNPLNGAALLTAFDGQPHHRWSWEHNADRPFETNHGLDLIAHHLAWVDPEVAPEPPPWRNRFLYESGNAVFRSGWEADDLWMLLVAEHGPARMTLHDHVDGTSFTLAAYGEYLLVDPGYYKPNPLDNARTAQAHAHNAILIEGEGAPRKGLLLDFGDTDAFLRHLHDGEALAWAEAHQTYQQTAIERGIAFVRQRYFLVVDRLATTHDGPREHRWRLGGYAGHEAGGTFAIEGTIALWERPLAGVEVHLGSTAPGLVLEEPPLQTGHAPHVHQMALNREVAHHGVIDGVVDGLSPGFLAVLAPYRVGASGADAPLQVEALEAPEGVTAFRVQGAHGADVALLRDPGAPTTLSLDGRTVETDAAFALFALEDGLAMMSRGTVLRVDGVERLTGDGEGVVVEEG